MTANLERAIQIAREAHEGQYRFDGSDYFYHPWRVMKMVKAQGHSALTQTVAILHDVPEDTEWTLDILREEGFDDEVLVPLELLTKPKGADYEGLYVPRLSVNPRARAVKKADLADNLDLTGLENPSLKRIMNIEKYGRSLMYLSRFPQPRL